MQLFPGSDLSSPPPNPLLHQCRHVHSRAIGSLLVRGNGELHNVGARADSLLLSVHFFFLLHSLQTFNLRFSTQKIHEAAVNDFREWTSHFAHLNTNPTTPLLQSIRWFFFFRRCDLVLSFASFRSIFQFTVPLIFRSIVAPSLPLPVHLSLYIIFASINSSLCFSIPTFFLCILSIIVPIGVTYLHIEQQVNVSYFSQSNFSIHSSSCFL